MGTSLSQIDTTYGHLLPDPIDRARMALDTFLAAGLRYREGSERAPTSASTTKTRSRMQALGAEWAHLNTSHDRESPA